MEIKVKLFGFGDSNLYLKNRTVIRQYIARTLPGPVNAKKRILVIGLPRSGTSWLAKCISLVNGVTYYFEPDLELVNRFSKYRDIYLPPDAEDPILENEINKMFLGNVCTEYQIAEKGLRELVKTPFCNTVLLKWVWLCNALEWFGRRFPDVKVVVVIRHPVGQFLSWQQRDWTPEFSLGRLLEQKPLMEGPLAPYAESMRAKSSYWRQAGSYWGAVTYMLWKANLPGKILREHEWYCGDASSRIHWLIDSLELQWDERIEEFLSPGRMVKSGPGYGERRDPKREVHKWKGKVSDSDLRELQSGIKEFGLPFFPDLDPEAGWAE